MSTIPVDLARTRAALAAATARTAELVAGIDDPARPVRGLTWTAGETAAHILIGLRVFTDAVGGRLDEWRGLFSEAPAYRHRMAAMTARTLAAEPAREPATLSRLIRAAGSAFLDTSAGHAEDELVPTPWYGEGRALPLGAATALLLGEQVVHGHDLARTLRVPWPVTPEVALLMLPALLSMMPVTLDPAAAAGARAAYAVHVRGGAAVALSLRDGTIGVEPLDGFRGRIDCHLSADPTAFVMVGYGRQRLVAAIARGRLLAWGRRPWLGLTLRGLFFNP